MSQINGLQLQDDELKSYRPRGDISGAHRWLKLTVGVILLIGIFGVGFVVYKSKSSSVSPEEDVLQPKAEPLLMTREQAAGSSFSRNPVSNGVCLTKGCVKAAARVIERMNDTADPCEDFYEFSCGNFVLNAVIPDKKSSVTGMSEIRDELKRKMRLVVEDQVTSADSGATKLAKRLFVSCMDTENSETRGLEPLREIIKELGGWPVVDGEKWNGENFTWIDANYINHELGYSSDILFNLMVSSNMKNSTMRMLHIDQPDFEPSREYLVLGADDAVVKAYLKYAIDAAELFGAHRSQAEEDMKEVVNFQIEMAKLSLSQEERRDMTKLVNFMTINEAMAILPGIPLVEYINKMLPEPLKVDASEVINVVDLGYVSNFTSLIARTPNRTLANYMIWMVVVESAEYLTKELREMTFEYSKVISGKTTRPPRWEECVDLVGSSLPYAIGNLYIKKFFKEESKAQVEELVTYLRDEFKNILNRVEWMDKITKQEALKKAEAMVPNIAYPKELLDGNLVDGYYSKLVIEDRNLLENMLNLSIFATDYHFSKLREPIDKLDWEQRPAVAQANAFYSFALNSLEFPAGILQGDFFQPDRPHYMNFGGIGLVIGHEITHGFDDRGKQFDLDGNLKDWWQPTTEKKFSEKAQCIIKQYGNFVAPEIGMKLNGVLTQGENIADNGGIKETYNAYQKWVRNHGPEDKLPGLNYTSNQLFWISSGQVWCSKYKSEYLRNMILTDEHSPGKYRINGPFSNSQEFSKDWDCPVGSKMNPKQKCVVW